MAFTLLGNNPVNFGDGWVLYNPIGLAAGRTYIMEILITATSPSQLYSSWRIRYAYPTQNSTPASSLVTQQVFYESIRQYFEFTISPIAQPVGNAIFAVRRFPFYNNPGTLADATIALATDPDLFY